MGTCGWNGSVSCLLVRVVQHFRGSGDGEGLTQLLGLVLQLAQVVINGLVGRGRGGGGEGGKGGRGEQSGTHRQVLQLHLTTACKQWESSWATPTALPSASPHVVPLHPVTALPPHVVSLPFPPHVVSLPFPPPPMWCHCPSPPPPPPPCGVTALAPYLLQFGDKGLVLLPTVQSSLQVWGKLSVWGGEVREVALQQGLGLQ